MTSVNKVQFASLNDKWYYFLDGIVCVPFGHQLRKSYPKIHTVIEKEKDKLLKFEMKLLKKKRDLEFYRVSTCTL